MFRTHRGPVRRHWSVAGCVATLQTVYGMDVCVHAHARMCIRMHGGSALLRGHRAVFPHCCYPCANCNLQSTGSNSNRVERNNLPGNVFISFLFPVCTKRQKSLLVPLHLPKWLFSQPTTYPVLSSIFWPENDSAMIMLIRCLPRKWAACREGG